VATTDFRGTPYLAGLAIVPGSSGGTVNYK
jgi:hypothetical protein